MKKLIISAVNLLFAITGCTNVTQTLYLQDIKVTGPVNNPPLHITNGQKKSSVTISPRLTLNTTNTVSGRLDGHTFVDADGIYRVEKIENSDGTWEYRESDLNKYEYKGKNLTWNIPHGSLGFDIDISLSNNVALFGGFNYVVQNQQDLFGGTAGIGFFSEKENNAIRMDLGVTWQNMLYDASSVVVTTIEPYNSPSKTYVTFFKDQDKSSSLNFFASFTYNTSFDDSPINFFINGSYFTQTLFDFEPYDPDDAYYPYDFTTDINDLRGDATAAFISVAPGIYQDIGIGKIILGVKIMKETQLNDRTHSFFILPVVQMDFRF